MKIKIDDNWKPQLRALLFFFLYLVKPRFYYISAGLMRSASHGDVSMMDVRLNTKHFEIRVRYSQIILMNRVGLSHHPWYVVSRRKHGCLLTMGFEHLENFLQMNERNKHNS